MFASATSPVKTCRPQEEEQSAMVGSSRSIAIELTEEYSDDPPDNTYKSHKDW
jgi:hypothetical protein